ncbi:MULTISPECIES: hypothetical protein [Streptomyces rochei group]|uniref:Uncharacterized protein n=1 Tax=Streptomyces plicatus TaxID=1922 RepID=A0ABW1Y8I0_STRPL|nr:hypothetical protein [Streptomyces plicatus]GGZ58404.1 hypothetical protein GCM10010301_33960 [Streptomyces plicatus]
MTGGPLRPRLPERPPTPGDLSERDRFAVLAEASLPTVRANAEAWRNGLAAFVTLVTTGVVLKGRDTTADLPLGWRTAVTLLIGGGIALCLAGLWQALAAQAGTREVTVSLADIHRRHASVAAYQIALADSAAARLRRGRTIVAVALLCLFLGIVATWWAPAAEPDPAAYVTVTHDGTSTCGTLAGADGGSVRIKVAGTAETVVVPTGKVTALRVVERC